MTAPADFRTTTDHTIFNDVQSELRWDPRIHWRDVGIAVKDGIITLSGTVPTYIDKEAAEGAAKRVYGVRGVVNDLRVVPDSATSDPEIAHEAMLALERQLLIPADSVTVVVKDGWITLEGQVRWQFQKKLAEWAVRKLKGVTGVTNRIALKADVSPSAVQQRVEEALRRSAAVDARRVVVDVDNDTVWLWGQVGTWSEREEVERAAWSAPGVARVENHVEVMP
jgi:osmotically-inducible protein OsmY